jgi:hypothetical protein
MIATICLPVWIRLAKDGLAVIVEHILPSLVMSGHYVTSRAPNYGIAAIVKAPVSIETAKIMNNLSLLNNLLNHHFYIPFHFLSSVNIVVAFDCACRFSLYVTSER